MRFIKQNLNFRTNSLSYPPIIVLRVCLFNFIIYQVLTMLCRLIADFIKDRQAGISLLTMGLMPLFLLMTVVAYDFGRFFMLSRVMSSATQQTAEWIKAKDAVNTYDFDSNDAKLYFDNLMKRHIVTTGSLAGGITSTNLELKVDTQRQQFWLVTKANYNLTVSKLSTGFAVPTLPLYTKVITKVSPPPLFVTIVFSAGEMQSEGEHAYGAGYDNQNNATKGVSWSSSYYTDAIGHTVTPRTTPTHNFYMVAALVKELTSKYIGTRKLYMNIIPVSATINLNPHGYSSSPQGSNETTLPDWIYHDTGFDYDNTSMAPKTSAICITNRTLPDVNSVGPMNYYFNKPDWEIQFIYRLSSFTPEYYRINTTANSIENSDFANNSLNSSGIYATDWFNDEEMLMDSSFLHYAKLTDASGTYCLYSCALAAQKRGYPFHFLDGSQPNTACPAIDSTPALATFQQVTSTTYPADTRSSNGTTLSGNQIFWDYMRNYIDPARQSSFRIWGSPNLAFGLQIAYENIGHVQNTQLINNNINLNAAGAYDPRSEFQVFVVSDQIGGVKNAGGASYINSNPTSIITKSRIPFSNKCINWPDGTLILSPILMQLCNPSLDAAQNATYFLTLPANSRQDYASGPFSFSHMWWDSAFNPASSACFANSMIGTQSCNVVYAATPLMVMKHFYNITNFALDLRYNKAGTNPMKRPKVYFIDTGSGKISNDCVNSNRNPYIDNYIYDGSVTSAAQVTQALIPFNQLWLKPCNAYAAMVGYETYYPTAWKPNWSSQAIFDPSTQYEGGIISMASDDTIAQSIDTYLASPTTYPVGPNSRAFLEQYAPADINVSGFDRVYTFHYTNPDATVFNNDPVDPTNRNIDNFASKYLPIVYYDSSYKMQVRSHAVNFNYYNSWDNIATVNNFTNAAKIAAFVVADTDWASPITRPKFGSP